jgi:hypothetical protein
MNTTTKSSLLDAMVDMLRSNEGTQHQVGATEYRVVSVRKRLGQIHVELEGDGSTQIVVLDISTARR